MIYRKAATATPCVLGVYNSVGGDQTVTSGIISALLEKPLPFTLS